MCNFFSFCTDGYGNRYYLDWLWRKDNLNKENDSHAYISAHFKVDEDKLNKYEYNFLTRKFKTDQINNEIDDRIQAEDWVRKLDHKLIIPQLIIKEIVNPLLLKPVKKVTEKDIENLKQWASVRDSVWDSVGDSVRASVGDSVGDSVRASARASVWASVWDSVRDSVWAYTSSFFDIKYEHDYKPLNDLWNKGLVPSFDGKAWRLYTGKDAKVVYGMKVN